MPNRPITVLGIDSTDNSLILSDHGKTTAHPGDTITWLIGNHSGVVSITSILPKGSINVFNPVPAPVAHSSNWRGTIDPFIDREIEEEYSIGYSTVGGGYGIDDPKIAVKPSKHFDLFKFIILPLAGLILAIFSLTFLKGRKK